ncbi:MAG: ABC transporter permease [Ktedonobacteraceae bacterium]
MKLQEPEAQHADLANAALPLPGPSSPLGTIGDFFSKTFTIAEWEVRKMRHDPTDIVVRSVQPALWLLIFGEVFTQIHAIPTGDVSYLEFMAPGILAQSVLFVAIFAGIAIIWERDLGVIHKFLASPTPRASLALGKALSSGIRTLPQALVIYLLSLLLGVHMNTNPLAILGVILMVVMGGACFSTFSLIIACLLKTRDRVMGIGQLLTMPLFFASNAIYPISIMPPWLQVIARVNPLTYAVDGLRALMLSHTLPAAAELGTDFGVLFAVTVVLVAIGAWLYPRLVQ